MRLIRTTAFFALIVLLAFAVSSALSADSRSQSNWRIYIKADDGAGMNSAGAMTVGAYSSSTDGPASDAQDARFNVSTPSSAKAVVGVFDAKCWIKDVKSPAGPLDYLSQTKVWDLRVAGLGSASTVTPIRLTFKTVTSSMLPPYALDTGEPVEYRLRMVDNRGVPGAPANGAEWSVPIPAAHSSEPFFTLTLPTINLSSKNDTQMIGEGYVLEFYQTCEVSPPDPGSVPGVAIGVPSEDSTASGPVSYTVTYSDALAVTLTADDVVLNKTGTANGTVSVTGSGTTTRTVSISDVVGNGTLGITIASGTASNAAGSAPAAGPSATFAVANARPVVAFAFPTNGAACTRNCSDLSISGTAGGSSTIVEVEWVLNGGTRGACTGTSEWSAAGITLEPGENELTVTATDALGDSETVVLTVTYVDAMPGDAWQGMAMVSLPIIPDQTDPKQVAGFDANRWYEYDPSLNVYRAYTDQQSWLDPADATPGRGFWASFPEEGASIPHGTIPSQDEPKTIHLLAGWNLIGQPFIESVQWDTDAIQVREPGGEPRPLAQSGGIVAPYAWGWDSVRRAYYLVMEQSSAAFSVSVMEPWRAYWVLAYRECDLILPPPSGD